MGALDFAGGTVVHIAAGVSGLAAILVLRKRIGYPEHAMHPNSMVLTLTGAGLLWFGWFGFNGGSALACRSPGRLGPDGDADRRRCCCPELDACRVGSQGQADRARTGLRSRRRSRRGDAGLRIRQTARRAWSIGLLAGVVCYAVVCLKPFFKYDDSLDAFGVHGVGGFLGALLDRRLLHDSH